MGFFKSIKATCAAYTKQWKLMRDVENALEPVEVLRTVRVDFLEATARQMRVDARQIDTLTGDIAALRLAAIKDNDTLNELADENDRMRDKLQARVATVTVLRKIRRGDKNRVVESGSKRIARHSNGEPLDGGGYKTLHEARERVAYLNK